MEKEVRSKRQLLKIMVGTGLIAPGLPVCLSYAGFRDFRQGLNDESFRLAKPSRHPDAASRTKGKATVPYLRESSRDLLEINETALETWSMCDGRHSIRDIAAVLSSRFDVPLMPCVDDISFTIRVFYQYGLISL